MPQLPAPFEASSALEAGDACGSLGILCLQQNERNQKEEKHFAIQMGYIARIAYNLTAQYYRFIQNDPISRISFL